MATIPDERWLTEKFEALHSQIAGVRQDLGNQVDSVREDVLVIKTELKVGKEPTLVDRITVIEGKLRWLAVLSPSLASLMTGLAVYLVSKI